MSILQNGPSSPPATADHANSPRAGGAECWLTASRFAAILGLLIAVSFPGVLFGGHTFVVRDFALFSCPVAQFQREAFWRGELPLWNPYNYCGLPFLAQWNTMCLYPPALIYLLLPLAWGLALFGLAHLFWGGLGMFLLARDWTRHALAAGLAGILFAFNGLNLNFLMWPSHGATMAWAPWVVLLVQWAWTQGGRTLTPAILAGVLQMLAGGPETILVTWILLLLLAGGDIAWNRQCWWRVGLRFGSMVLLVALVCAAQLLPFLHLVVHSQRGTGFGGSGWPMPIWGWANLLVPLFKTFPDDQGIFFQPGQSWTTSYYAGVISLFLAAVSLGRARNWRVWMLAGLTVIALVLSLGDDGVVYRVLRKLAPALGYFRYPVKFVIPLTLTLPLLAAFGLAAIVRRESPRLGPLECATATATAALIAVIALLGWRSPVEANTGWFSITNGGARLGLFLLMVFTLGLLLKTSASRRKPLWALLLATVWLDLWTHVPNQNPTVRQALFAREWTGSMRDWAPAPALGQSRAMLAPVAEETLRKRRFPDLQHNLLVSRLSLLADCNLLEQTPTPYGFFSLVPEHIDNAAVLPYMNTNRDYAPLLDFMGVAQITAPDDVLKWVPRATAMPLVTAGQRVYFAQDSSAYEGISRTNIDFRRVVVLPAEADGAIAATQRVSAQVLSSRFGIDRAEAEIESPSNCMAVISQSWHPGWKAKVDGKTTPVWRANYAFQAVEVPAGRHRVELYFRDDRFAVGTVLSGCGLLAWLGLAVVNRPRRSRPAST